MENNESSKKIWIDLCWTKMIKIREKWPKIKQYRNEETHQ